MPQFSFPATLEFRSVQCLVEADCLKEALEKFDNMDFQFDLRTGSMVNFDRTGPVSCDDGSRTFECEELE